MNYQQTNETFEIFLLLLKKLNEVGIALSTEKNISILMEKILLAAKDLTNAEGGTIYLVDAEKKNLSFEIMLNDVLHIHYGGSGGDRPPFPPLPIYLGNDKINETLVAAYCAGYKKKVNIQDAYLEKGFDFRGTKAFDARMKYRSKALLTVPMLDAKNEVLGVLQLINPRSPIGGIKSFNLFDEHMVESLTSQASVSFSNRRLLEESQQLFMSMIDMINIALDEKSPHTSKHCQRVPVITMMLADAVVDYKKGPMASYALEEEERNALRIAALLHDCGKIVTPVHVIDKSKKLDLLSDQFFAIEQRAETVRKQLEIDAMKRGVTGNFGADSMFKNQLADLEKDLEFLRNLNAGLVKVDQVIKDRLQAISNRWSTETYEGVKIPFLTPNELNYLSISSGNLTAEERQVINYHVTASIKMLESLPWPERLKNVPEYAGGHHERIDGKGYPRGLTGKQMSVPARIMGIADVFEALTAKDRPYKTPKKLSEALDIMDTMANTGHIDPELYRIFIDSKVYWKYASEYLTEEQQDITHHSYEPSRDN